MRDSGLSCCDNHAWHRAAVSRFAYGNVLSQTIQPLNATDVYTYDAANRISTASEGEVWTQNYTYDAYGNRAVVVAGTNYIPNSSSTPQVPTVGSPLPYSNNQWTGATYNPAGNITAQNGTTFTYDPENRQTSASQVVNGTTYTTNYSYDGEGRRVMKVLTAAAVTTATTVYVYDAMEHLAAEYAMPAPEMPCVTCYLTVDHLGSTRVVTDANQSIIRHDYLPFGEEIGTSNRATLGYTLDNVAQKFTGKERDAETSLDYFESRYFSAAQGRFTSPDEPFAGWNQQDPQTWNLYSYGRNNPLKYVDPDGHDPCVNGINPETGNICTVVTAKKSKPEPPPDVVLDSPLFFAVARGVQQAKPGVDLAGAGLMTFFSLVAPFTSAATQCVAGNCDKTNLAMAVIPGGAAEQTVAKLTRWGWTGTKKFLTAVRVLKNPGTHEALEGIIPTLEEAKELIQKAGGTIDRIEEGHAMGGVSEHTYPHINYTTPSGSKATVRVEGVGK